MAITPTTKVSRWKEPDFYTVLALTLWVIVSEISKLDPYFISGVGVGLFVLFIGIVTYNDYSKRKFDLQANLDKLNAERQAESLRLFTTEVQGASSRLGASMELRRAVLDTVILMLEDSLRNTTFSGEKRDTYNEILNRVRDMQRSLFGNTYEVQFEEARRRALESRPPASEPRNSETPS